MCKLHEVCKQSKIYYTKQPAEDRTQIERMNVVNWNKREQKHTYNENDNSLPIVIL